MTARSRSRSSPSQAARRRSMSACPRKRGVVVNCQFAKLGTACSPADRALSGRHEIFEVGVRGDGDALRPSASVRLRPIEHKAADRGRCVCRRISAKRHQEVDQDRLIGVERGVLDAALLLHPATEASNRTCRSPGQCRPGLLQRRLPLRRQDVRLTQTGDEQRCGALWRTSCLAAPEHRPMRRSPGASVSTSKPDAWTQSAHSASRRTTSVIIASVYFRCESQSLKSSTCGCSQLIRTSTLRRCLRFRFVTTCSFELLVHAGSTRRVEQTEGFDPIPCDRRFVHWTRTQRVRGDPSGAACVVGSEHGGRDAGG